MSELRARFPGLRDLTNARVALPTTGNSLATTEVLAFQQAHAQARDAVHASVDFASLAQNIAVLMNTTPLQLKSNAPNRAAYLRQPHLGRTLHPDSLAQLHPTNEDLSIVIADGLSSTAVEEQTIPLLQHLLPNLGTYTVTLVEQGRVAIGDPIGHALNARFSLVLIGERPGLSCSNSLGAYLTASPRPGRTDAERNCISNIHNNGLRPPEAAARILLLLEGARALGCTGTALKDDTEHPRLPEVN